MASNQSVDHVDGNDVEPIVEGSHIALWHMENRFIPAVHDLVMEPQTRAAWRSRGLYWSRDELQARISNDSFLSAMATLVDDRTELVGLVELLDYDMLDQRAQFGLVTARKYWHTGLGIEASLLFLRFAFDAYPLQKVVVMVYADQAKLLPGLHRMLEHEGHFKRHLNIHGRWHDIDSFALWRDALPELERRLLLVSSLGGGA